MNYLILGDVDITALEEKTGARAGYIHPIPIACLKQFSRPQLLTFMLKYGLYSFPTDELIEYFATKIKGKKAIEIGCGLGVIGRTLGIPITDSKQQERPEIIKYYKDRGQPVIQYPPDVEKLSARAAIRKYQPEIVIASYITHLWRPGMKTGNQFGVDMIDLINNTQEFYMVGNLDTHFENPAMKYLEGIERYDFVVTRGEPERNVIFRWRKPHFKKNLL